MPGPDQGVVVDDEDPEAGRRSVTASPASAAGPAPPRSPCPVRSAPPPGRRGAPSARRSSGDAPGGRPGTSSGSNPRPRSRTKTETGRRLDLGEHRHVGAPRPLGGVDGGLPAGADQGRRRRRPSGSPPPGSARARRRRLSSISRSMPAIASAKVLGLVGVPAQHGRVEQPVAELALLDPGQARHLGRVAGGLLDQQRGSGAPSRGRGSPCRPAPRPAPARAARSRGPAGSGPTTGRRGRGSRPTKATAPDQHAEGRAGEVAHAGQLRRSRR